MKRFLVNVASDAAPGGYGPYYIYAMSIELARLQVPDLGGPFNARILSLFEVPETDK